MFVSFTLKYSFCHLSAYGHIAHLDFYLSVLNDSMITLKILIQYCGNFEFDKRGKVLIFMMGGAHSFEFQQSHKLMDNMYTPAEGHYLFEPLSLW